MKTIKFNKSRDLFKLSYFIWILSSLSIPNKADITITKPMYALIIKVGT